MNGCVVAEKTLVVIKETKNHVQLTNYSTPPLERSPFYRRFRFSEYFVNDGFLPLLCLCIDRPL